VSCRRTGRRKQTGAAVLGAVQLRPLSEATVETQLVHVFAELEVTDRAAAVATAYERGILPG
jgi:ATP/maltotriose-dependent transcriptional regulator MalT